MDNLPKSAETHDQERRSRLKLQLIIPESLFLYREETKDDYGVDVVLELRLHQKAMSNFRAHAQLKSVSTNRIDLQGELSYPVPIKTLNYLLNQINSVFIVYVEQEDVFLWAWAVDIYKFARRKGIDTRTTKQETISYRFHRVMNGYAFENIHSQVLVRGRMFRDLTEIIENATGREEVTSTVNLTTGQVTTTDEAKNLMKRFGYDLIASGQFKVFEKLLAQLPIGTATDPETRLIIAYYHFHAGRYLDSVGYLPNAEQQQKLDATTKDLSRYLNVIVRFYIGIINSEQYSAQINQIAESPSESTIALQIRMFQQKNALTTADPTKIDEYITLEDEYEKTLRRLERVTSNNGTAPVRIKLALWDLEGFRLIRILNNSFHMVRIREMIGHAIPNKERTRMARDFFGKVAAWKQTFLSMNASGWPSPAMEAIAYLSFAHSEMQFQSNFQALGLGTAEELNDQLSLIRDNLIHYCNVLETEAYLHEALRAKIYLAQCLHGLNETEQAKGIYEDVRAKAQLLSMSDIERLVNAVEKHPIFGLKDFIQKSAKTSEEILFSTDEDYIGKLSRSIVRNMGIPEERIAVVAENIKWIKEDVIEKRLYCRHLQMIEDKTHSSSLETMYAVNPDKMYLCRKTGAQSSYGSQDRESLLASFKANNCLGCMLKEPLIKE